MISVRARDRVMVRVWFRVRFRVRVRFRIRVKFRVGSLTFQGYFGYMTRTAFQCYSGYMAIISAP